MFLKNLLNKLPMKQLGRVGFQSRLYSSSTSEFEVVKERYQPDFVILKLDRAPVNSLNLEAVKDLGHQLDMFEKNPKIKGVIITSDIPDVFSAGLDIMELYQADPERLETLWVGVQNLWEKLYGSQKIYMAAMNGHAVAFGCLLAMACDYRIMASENNFKTGISAPLLGLTPPSWIKDTMINTIGFRKAESALQLGQTFTPQQALDIKLVDEIVPQKDVLKAAEKEMQLWCQIPHEARGITKQLIRSDTVNRFKLNRVNDLKEFVESTSSPSVQVSIKNYLKTLKNQHHYL